MAFCGAYGPNILRENSVLNREMDNKIGGKLHRPNAQVGFYPANAPSYFVFLEVPFKGKPRGNRIGTCVFDWLDGSSSRVVRATAHAPFVAFLLDRHL
uniref:CUB domain-containing protein n=1 Tax=Angiostrongylus cantonensis TaxID=6313 RepID=A0A158P9P2_ANGCA